MLRQSVEVLHPVELLARQLIERTASRYHARIEERYRPEITGEPI
jgi:hypothetical protein